MELTIISLDQAVKQIQDDNKNQWNKCPQDIKETIKKYFKVCNHFKSNEKYLFSSPGLFYENMEEVNKILKSLVRKGYVEYNRYTGFTIYNPHFLQLFN
jgi:hemerythrin superfamily protein